MIETENGFIWPIDGDIDGVNGHIEGWGGITGTERSGIGDPGSRG